MGNNAHPQAQGILNDELVFKNEHFLGENLENEGEDFFLELAELQRSNDLLGPVSFDQLLELFEFGDFFLGVFFFSFYDLLRSEGSSNEDVQDLQDEGNMLQVE